MDSPYDSKYDIIEPLLEITENKTYATHQLLCSLYGVQVDGLRLCLRTPFSIALIVHPPIYEYGEPRWNDTDGIRRRTQS
jgi:hypothetical protein